jgi:hypothetical protein
VIFYQNLVSAKVKVEDAEVHARAYLAKTFQLDEDNIEAELANWQKNGLKLDKEAIFLLDYLEYTKGLYNKKLKQFPYSVMAELFKIKSV